MYLLERNVNNAGNWIPLAVAENAETLKTYNQYVGQAYWTQYRGSGQVGIVNEKQAWRITWILRMYA